MPPADTAEAGPELADRTHEIAVEAGLGQAQDEVGGLRQVLLGRRGGPDPVDRVADLLPQ